MNPDTRIPHVSLSGFYLLYFAVLGAFVPYWSLYLEAQGVSPAWIGLVLAIPGLTKILVPFIWGQITHRHLQLFAVIRAASLFSLMIFAVLLWPWDMAALVSVMFAYTLFQGIIMPLFDTLTLEHLDGDSHRYARIRVWGSIGFIVAVMATGELLHTWLPVSGLPYLILLLLGSVWVVSLTVPAHAASHPHQSDQSLLHVVRRREVATFLLACLLLQFGHGPYYAFFSIYLDAHGYSRRDIGSLWSLGVLAEILLFLLIPAILARFSLRAVFVTSLVLGGLRWCLLGWAIDVPFMILLIQCLHAASFGSAHVAAVHLVQHHFRGTHHATGQALYGSVSFGLGGMLGSLAAGYFWVPLGASGVYTLAGIVSFAGAWLAAWGMGKTDSR